MRCSRAALVAARRITRLLIGRQSHVDSCTGERQQRGAVALHLGVLTILAPVILRQDEWAYETPTGTMQCRRHQGSLDATEPSLRRFRRTTDIRLEYLWFLGKILYSLVIYKDILIGLQENQKNISNREQHAKIKYR